MIGEFFLNIVFSFICTIFDLLPAFTWNVDTSAFHYICSILEVAGYMFPWRTVVDIVELIIGLMLFRIVIAFIKSIWDLLPFA